MTGRLEVDTARLPLLLTELRLPAIGRLWAEMAERSDREGWPAARFLSTIAELEIAERARRRVERHLLEARLPPDKTLDGFDFAHVPMLSRARVTALASGDAWLNRGKNLLLFGPPGSGKTHIAAALGRTLVENGYRVLFTRTTIWCSAFKPRDRTSPSKPPSPGSIATICLCWTISHMSAKTRPKRPSCLS